MIGFLTHDPVCSGDFPPSTEGDDDDDSSTTLVIILAVVGGLVLLFVIIVIVLCCVRSRRQNSDKVEILHQETDGADRQGSEVELKGNVALNSLENDEN